MVPAALIFNAAMEWFKGVSVPLVVSSTRDNYSRIPCIRETISIVLQNDSILSSASLVSHKWEFDHTLESLIAKRMLKRCGDLLVSKARVILSIH
ncbi:unnamed protein product [Penicillium roqueforti FM164]|uniref:Genomic scaffold, ProqFM164S02 n=1 Tax=Penicillium roqueforti (strain FM164) TaxID=1365484 RepID=W6Q3V2_PENRF|nr:unnamed protein product [Penicillium roqueforti FM164]